MKINRDNYEAYFIDYLEGNLDEKLVDDFLEFLLQNPDLKNELSLFDSAAIEPEEIIFNKKELLLKEKYDHENEFNEAAIASLEGDISATDKIEFENYILAHPEKKKEIALFTKTKLQPDESITFNKKNTIYRYSVGKTVFNWSVRIAAVLVLAIAFYVLIDKSSTEIVPEIKVAAIEDETGKKEVSEEPKIIPEEKERSTIEKTKQPEIKPVIKATKTEPAKGKSLRETTKGRMEHEGLAETRTPVEVPAEMNRIMASLEIVQAPVSLASMQLEFPDILENNNDERLLADVIIEKTGLDKFSLNKISKAGLNLVSTISKDKFQYETNEEGKIVEYNYDSRLLAFSIPTKNEDAGE